MSSPTANVTFAARRMPRRNPREMETVANPVMAQINAIWFPTVFSNLASRR